VPAGTQPAPELGIGIPHDMHCPAYHAVSIEQTIKAGLDRACTATRIYGLDMDQELHPDRL